MRVRVATTIVLGISVLQLKRGSNLVRFVQKGRVSYVFITMTVYLIVIMHVMISVYQKTIIRRDTWHLEPHNTMTYSEISASFT